MRHDDPDLFKIVKPIEPGDPVITGFIISWLDTDGALRETQTRVWSGAFEGAGCRVYWGSHGCDLRRGHEGSHVCACCDCPPGHHDGVTAPFLVDDDGVLCVARAPYYGPDTNFYGEDVEERG